MSHWNDMLRASFSKAVSQRSGIVMPGSDAPSGNKGSCAGDAWGGPTFALNSGEKGMGSLTFDRRRRTFAALCTGRLWRQALNN